MIKLLCNCCIHVWMAGKWFGHWQRFHFSSWMTYLEEGLFSVILGIARESRPFLWYSAVWKVLTEISGKMYIGRERNS